MHLTNLGNTMTNRTRTNFTPEFRLECVCSDIVNLATH